MNMIDQKELNRLKRKGFSIASVKETVTDPVQAFGNVTAESLKAIKMAIELNLSALSEFGKQGKMTEVKAEEISRSITEIGKLLRPGPEWTEITLTPKRGADGLIESITIKRIK